MGTSHNSFIDFFVLIIMALASLSTLSLHAKNNPVTSKKIIPTHATSTSSMPACPTDQSSMIAPCLCPNGKIAFNACVYIEGNNNRPCYYQCQQ